MPGISDYSGERCDECATESGILVDKTENLRIRNERHQPLEDDTPAYYTINWLEDANVPPMDVIMDGTNTAELNKEDASVEAVARSPRHIPTDSMVTVPLSEGTSPEESVRGSILQPQIIVEERRDSSRPSSSEILKAFGRRGSQASIDSPAASVNDMADDSPRGRNRRQSEDSGKSEPVDWAKLEKKEEQEPEGEGQDKVLT